jgi:flagellar basal body rod protein FlgF
MNQIADAETAPGTLCRQLELRDLPVQQEPVESLAPDLSMLSSQLMELNLTLFIIDHSNRPFDIAIAEDGWLRKRKKPGLAFVAEKSVWSGDHSCVSVPVM